MVAGKNLWRIGRTRFWQTGLKKKTARMVPCRYGQQEVRMVACRPGEQEVRMVACRSRKQEVSMMAARKNHIASRDNNDRQN
jgi:hypothetical protein